MKTLLLSCSSSAETPVSPVSLAPAGCAAQLFARGREKEKAESRQFRLPGLEQLRGTREPSHSARHDRCGSGGEDVGIAWGSLVKRRFFLTLCRIEEKLNLRSNHEQTDARCLEIL
ncbi:hypothetical protein K0M31_004317 [Melipona bicolor]|uniref:Uncharacterized protein n=1 Tax=Melipona bicolor TaxID=60889 RepID=A0AA40KN61_9HYME|nr:hypothetical protein K0M31_004317 [Melipona bicolor]